MNEEQGKWIHHGYGFYTRGSEYLANEQVPDHIAALERDLARVQEERDDWKRRARWHNEVRQATRHRAEQAEQQLATVRELREYDQQQLAALKDNSQYEAEIAGLRQQLAEVRAENERLQERMSAYDGMATRSAQHLRDYDVLLQVLREIRDAAQVLIDWDDHHDMAEPALPHIYDRVRAALTKTRPYLEQEAK